LFDDRRGNLPPRHVDVIARVAAAALVVAQGIAGNFASCGKKITCCYSRLTSRGAAVELVIDRLHRNVRCFPALVDGLLRDKQLILKQNL
jgi:hypothetical protein